MEYRRLSFSQYFIDSSGDYLNTGRARFPITYQSVEYSCHALERILGIRHAVNYAIRYEAERDVIQIHFEKTNGASDWFSNIAEFSSKYYDAFMFRGAPITLHVHHGWGIMYKAVKHQIRDGWKAMHDSHPTAVTEVIGWSLGSGQAMLCCQDLNYNFGVHPYLYTFGSVKPFRARRGEEEQLRRYLDSICREVYNFAVSCDIVTYMPPFRRFTMLRRIPIGDSHVTVGKLLNPNYYHTMYGEEELYRDIQ